MKLALPALNPVLGRELTQRMRARHAWIVLVIYLAILGIILRLVYAAVDNDPFAGFGGDVLAAASAGRSIFHWLLFFMLALVCFIVPGVTAGAIAGERERQTLVSLQVTLLRPRSIVFGKLWASLAFVLLLIVAALPLVGVTFVLGGVAASEVVAGLAMVAVSAMALACLALACSSLFRRTQGATVTAYGITAVLVIGTFIGYGAQAAIRVGRGGQPSVAILALNPFVAVADVVRGRSRLAVLGSPFEGIQGLIDPDQSFDQLEFERGQARGIPPGLVLADGPVPVTSLPPPFPPPPISIGGGGISVGRVEVSSPDEAVFAQPVPTGGSGQPGPGRVAGMRVWIASTLAFGLVGAAALALATRRVAVPKRGASA